MLCSRAATAPFFVLRSFPNMSASHEASISVLIVPVEPPDMDPDALVYFRHDNGYSYGAINDCRIREATLNESGYEVNEDDYDPDNEMTFE